MAKQARKSAAVVSAPASTSPWTSNDRNGEVSRSTVREMSVRATLGLPIDSGLLADVLGLVEDILIATATATGGAPTLDDVPGEIRELEESRVEAVKAEEESTRDLKQDLSDLKESTDVTARELAAVADACRKQADRAEHELAEALKRVEAGDQAVRDLAALRRILLGG